MVIIAIVMTKEWHKMTMETQCTKTFLKRRKLCKLTYVECIDGFSKNMHRYFPKVGLSIYGV